MSHNSHREEEKPFLDEDQLESTHHVVIHQSRDRKLIVILATIAVISWLVTLYVVLVGGRSDPHSTLPKDNMLSSDNAPSNTYFPTDLKAIRASISYEPRVYTGALYYNETAKRFFRNTTSDEPAYVGFPSRAIDEAWEGLLHNEFAPLTDEETEPFLPRLTTFNGKYYFEPDMFHSLHCLNEVRKRIDFGYYTSSDHHGGYKVPQEDWDRIHIDHCLDQIRQAIMCFGDLSPVPLYSWKGIPLAIGQGSVHTCRKWDPIRQWVDQRHIDFNEA